MAGNSVYAGLFRWLSASKAVVELFPDIFYWDAVFTAVNADKAVRADLPFLGFVMPETRFWEFLERLFLLEQVVFVRDAACCGMDLAVPLVNEFFAFSMTVLRAGTSSTVA